MKTPLLKVASIVTNLLWAPQTRPQPTAPLKTLATPKQLQEAPQGVLQQPLPLTYVRSPWEVTQVGRYANLQHFVALWE